MLIDWHFIARLLPELLQGAVVTVELAVLTMVICVVWGLLVALAQNRTAPRPWRTARRMGRCRGSPAATSRWCATRRC